MFFESVFTSSLFTHISGTRFQHCFLFYYCLFLFVSEFCQLKLNPRETKGIQQLVELRHLDLNMIQDENMPGNIYKGPYCKSFEDTEHLKTTGQAKDPPLQRMHFRTLNFKLFDNLGNFWKFSF